MGRGQRTWRRGRSRAARWLALLAAGLVLAGPGEDQFNFAEGLFIRADYVSAAEEYAAYLKQWPQGPQAATARFRQAECAFRRERWQDAARAYAAALAQHPRAEGADLAHYNRARVLKELGQWEGAAEAFGRAASSKRAELRQEALIGQGEALAKLGRSADAAKAYGTFLQGFPDSNHRPVALYGQGWALLRTGQAEAAGGPLRELLAKYPDHELAPRARLALGDAELARGEFAAARELFSGLLGRPEQKEAALLRLAWAEFRAGRKQAAAKSFLAFAEAFPDSPQKPIALYNAGIARYDQQDFVGAAQVFERLAADAPASPEAGQGRFWLGLCYARSERLAQAEKTLAPLLQALPDDPESAAAVLYTVAQARAARGAHAEALPLLAQLLADFGKTGYRAHALYARALALAETGQVAEAREPLRELLQLGATPQRRAALFALAEYSYRLDDPKAALAPLRELAAGEQVAPAVRYRLGWVCSDLGHHVEARQQFLALAEQEAARRSEALYLAGRAAEALGEPANAVRDYQAAVQQEPDAFVEKAHYRLGFLLTGAPAEANFAAYGQAFPAGQHRAALALKLAEADLAAGRLDAARGRYQQLPELGKLSAAEQRARDYGLGWCHLRTSELAAAEEVFARVEPLPGEEGLPEIVADARLQRAEIAYRQERFAEAAKLFEGLTDGRGLRSERALYMRGWCARQLGHAAESIPWFRRLLAEYEGPEARFRVDGGLRLAEALAAEGETTEARKIIESVREGAAAEQREELLQVYADTLVTLCDWQALLPLAKDLLADYPDSEFRYLNHFRLGLAQQAVGLLDEAEASFRATIEATDTVEAARAQFNLGSIDFARQEYTRAGKEFLRVEMLYDYEDLAPKSLYHAIDSFLRAPDGRERAARYLDVLQEKYPDSPWTPRAAKLFAKD